MNLIVVNVATGRDARAVSSAMAEQFWKEGQQRVNGESGKQADAEVDITYVPNKADALKSLSRALLFYRSDSFKQAGKRQATSILKQCNAAYCFAKMMALKFQKSCKTTSLQDLENLPNS